MRPLTDEYQFNTDDFDGKFSKLSDINEKPKISSEKIVQGLRDLGLKIRSANPKIPKSLSLVSVDSSVAKSEYRLVTLWAQNLVAVLSKSDGQMHDDKLCGHGNIPYHDILYETKLEGGIINNQNNLEKKISNIRALNELKFLSEKFSSLKKKNSADYGLIDGSLSTIKSNLDTVTPNGQETRNALMSLTKTQKIVGMVEDSYANDISKKLGYSIPNVTIFDMCLDPFEYVIQKDENIYVCYLKLPEKKLNYSPIRSSKPLVVRWEFTSADFSELLSSLIALWITEDDLFHPQIYPMRISDHLTRKVKLSGIIDQVAAKYGLEKKFRNLRYL